MQFFDCTLTHNHWTFVHCRVIAKVERAAPVLCVGEFVEFRDAEEYSGADPCDYLAIVVGVHLLIISFHI